MKRKSPEETGGGEDARGVSPASSEETLKALVGGAGAVPLGNLRVDADGGGEWAPKNGEVVSFEVDPLPAPPPPPPKPTAPERPTAEDFPTSQEACQRPPGEPPSAARHGDLSTRIARTRDLSLSESYWYAKSVPSLLVAEELAQEVRSDYESDISNGESDFARPVVPWSIAAAAASPSSRGAVLEAKRGDAEEGSDDDWGTPRSFYHVKFVLGKDSVALGVHLVLPCSAPLARFLGSVASSRGIAEEETCPLVLRDEGGSQLETSCQIRQMCAVQEPGSQRPFQQSWFCVAKPARPGGQGWGLFARVRRLQEGDTVLFTFRGGLGSPPEVADTVRPPVLCFKVSRARQPPPLQVLEPNVESEVSCESRPLDPAIPRLFRPFKYCKESFPCASFLKAHKCGKYWRTSYAPVSHRLRVVQSGGGRGWGVLALEDIPAGTHVFNYCGEVLDVDAAARREETYRLETPGGECSGGKNRPNFLYDIVAPPDPGLGAPRTLSAVIDSTQHGSVARFVNHRCEDASLRVEVKLAQKKAFLTQARHRCNSLILPEIRFFTKYSVAAGEELTVDYLSGDRPDVTINPQKLRRELRCTCTSPMCRGWIF